MADTSNYTGFLIRQNKERLERISTALLSGAMASGRGFAIQKELNADLIDLCLDRAKELMKRIDKETGI